MVDRKWDIQEETRDGGHQFRNLGWNPENRHPFLDEATVQKHEGFSKYFDGSSARQQLYKNMKDTVNIVNFTGDV